MEKIILIATSLFLVFSVSTKGLYGNENSASTEIPNWYLIWNDEFEGDSVDNLKWVIEDAALVKNNELQYYTPEDVYVHDGVLTLRSQERSMGGRSYTSGLVETKGKFTQKYGRFAIRAKLPKGKGIWPAHWLLPAGDKWPPEIDIMEMLGHEPNVIHGTVHWGVWPKNQHRGSRYVGPDFSEDFHIFAVEWDPGKISCYVDDKEYFSTKSHIPQEPMRIILNTAVGGDWPGNPDDTTIFPQYHDIDYVRVYVREVKDMCFLKTFAYNGEVITDPPGEEYTINSKVKLSAKPNTMYKFSHWSGDISGSDNPIEIVMDKHKKIRANFIVDPEAPVLLSKGKVVKASSIERDGLPEINVADGDLRTRWASDFSEPQWIYVDLGKVYSIETVRLHWENAYGKVYQIQVSDDAVEWENVYSTEEGDGNIDEITDIGTAARYVKMLGKERGTQWGFSLWEFEVFGRE